MQGPIFRSRLGHAVCTNWISSEGRSTGHQFPDKEDNCNLSSIASVHPLPSTGLRPIEGFSYASSGGLLSSNYVGAFAACRLLTALKALRLSRTFSEHCSNPFPAFGVRSLLTYVLPMHVRLVRSIFFPSSNLHSCLHCGLPVFLPEDKYHQPKHCF